jgi:hypothetical protein
MEHRPRFRCHCWQPFSWRTRLHSSGMFLAHYPYDNNVECSAVQKGASKSSLASGQQTDSVSVARTSESSSAIFPIQDQMLTAKGGANNFEEDPLRMLSCHLTLAYQSCACEGHSTLQSRESCAISLFTKQFLKSSPCNQPCMCSACIRTCIFEES